MKSCMEELALSFPTLSVAPGTMPWDPEAFERWARGPAPSHGAKCAAQFVLWVWNPHTRWRCGRFDLREALCRWDDEHRAAFARWAAQAWWP